MDGPTDSPVQIIPVTSLPADCWVEGFALRPNGHMIATRLDAPELYTCDPDSLSTPPTLMHTFPDANGLINICALEGAPDEYAVISGIVDVKTSQFGTCVVWRVSLVPGAEGGEEVKVSKIADMPNASFCIGVTPAGPDTLLVADCYEDCIRTLDIATGTSQVLVADATMKVASAEDFFGINRIRVAAGFVWYTNTSAGLLCRVPVASDAGAGLRAAGPVEIVASTILHCDGLVVADDGKSVFSANYLHGVMWRVDVDEEGKGDTKVLRTGLRNPTSMELVDGKRLYVICCGDEKEVAWVNDEAKSENNLEISVSVVEEVVEQV